MQMISPDRQAQARGGDKDYHHSREKASGEANNLDVSSDMLAAECKEDPALLRGQEKYQPRLQRWQEAKVQGRRSDTPSFAACIWSC